VVVSAMAFSRELALVAPIAFDSLESKEIVNYNFVMGLADQRGNVYVLDFTKNRFVKRELFCLF
jgi:hypothetical protein